MVWFDEAGGNNSIFFKRSTDGRRHFDKTKNLSPNSGESITPDIAAFRYDVYIVWPDNTQPGEFSDIFLRKSTDKGEHFDGTKNLRLMKPQANQQ